MSGDDPIVVLDDLFPHVMSAFRYAEFGFYLARTDDIVVHTTGGALSLTGDTRPFGDIIGEYLDANPSYAGRVLPFDRSAFPKGRLYYAIFTHILLAHIDAIEAVGAPFVFTLYPGGGFAVDDPEGDARLARIFGSPCFAHVITTQAITRDYLLRKGFCDADRILPLYGGVMPECYLAPPEPKRRFGQDKATLDLCFVANRYTPRGEDKGYDLFVDAAKILLTRADDIRFHVVGRFDETIIDLESAADAFTFHGRRPSPFFREFYSAVDAIVSPTRPGMTYPGSFDGFPTGCSVEAGLNGAAVLCTDALGLNRDYVDGRDLLIVSSDPEGIAATILDLRANPHRLWALGDNARRRMIGLFSPDVQLPPRLRLLQHHASVAGLLAAE